MGKDGTLLAWTAVAILTLLAGIGAWGMWREPSLLGAAALGGVVLAALLLLPPLWRNQVGILRSFRIAAAVVLTAIGFFLPVKTHMVKLDLPKPSYDSHTN